MQTIFQILKMWTIRWWSGSNGRTVILVPIKPQKVSTKNSYNLYNYESKMENGVNGWRTEDCAPHFRVPLHGWTGDECFFFKWKWWRRTRWVWVRRLTNGIRDAVMAETSMNRSDSKHFVCPRTRAQLRICLMT